MRVNSLKLYPKAGSWCEINDLETENWGTNFITFHLRSFDSKFPTSFDRPNICISFKITNLI